MRTLSWKHTLGLVTMDVELADRTLSVAVTRAGGGLAILPGPSYLDLGGAEQGGEDACGTAAAADVRVVAAGRAEGGACWDLSVVEEERPQDRDSMVLIDSDEESDSGMASQADQKEEELLLFGHTSRPC